MIGLLLKILLFIVGTIVAILFVLNVTNVWNPGTLSFSPPSVEPCQRYAQTPQFKKQGTPTIVDVRWIMTQQNYGWGCYFEFTDFTQVTVTPMPK